MLQESVVPLHGVRNLVRRIFLWRLGVWLVGLLLIPALGWVLVTGYLGTRRQVGIYDGEQRLTWRTHQTSVAAVLREAGVLLGPEDIVSPGPDASVQDGDVIRVLRARQATVIADGQVKRFQTHAKSVENLLREADLQLASRDWLTLNGERVALDTSLFGLGEGLGERPGGMLRAVSSRGQGRSALPLASDAPIEIVVHRAVPLRVDDDGMLLRIHTTHQTIGEALLAEGIALYLGDEISPAMDEPVRPDLEVVVRRSRSAEIAADGKHIRTRTQAATVGQILAQEGIALEGLDYTLPPEDAPLPDDQPVRVVRVQRVFAVEQEPIPYETVWLPDPELDLDHQRLEQEGEEGVHRWRYNVIYENGQQVSQSLEEEWLAREPTDKIISYGTQITVRDLETPNGTLQYWRRIRMLATSYTAATSGKTKDQPLYGITRLGWKMRHGIVAVDPTVVKLGGQVYVPGYGIGDVADTGGGIKGRRIDLGYDEDSLVWWLKWVDVYVLTPIPPTSQIRYVLPNWPQQP